MDIGSLNVFFEARCSIHLASDHFVYSTLAVLLAVPGRFSAENAYGSALKIVSPFAVSMAYL